VKLFPTIHLNHFAYLPGTCVTALPLRSLCLEVNMSQLLRAGYERQDAWRCEAALRRFGPAALTPEFAVALEIFSIARYVNQGRGVFTDVAFINPIQ